MSALPKTGAELLAQAVATCLCGKSFPGTAYGTHYHHNAAGWVECFSCRDTPEETASMADWSSYTADLNGRRPPVEDLRREEPGKPTVGDLIQPGAIVRTNYGSCPYLVDKVTPHSYYGDFRAWSISGFAPADDGGYIRDEHRRFWINELVVDHTGAEPVIRKLFMENPDVVTIEGATHAHDRRGQGLLL